jgi:COP9 signalosome complex subunit 2
VRLADGSDDAVNSPSELIQIYALKMRVQFAQGEVPYAMLKDLFLKTQDLAAPVEETLSQSSLEEWRGRYFASDGEWRAAHESFERAFQLYQQLRFEDRARNCLKYMILCNILLGGELNPFTSAEAKVLQSHAEIRVFSDLRQAFFNNDTALFSKCNDAITAEGDEFVLNNIKGMVRDFHLKAICNIVKSYRKIKLNHLADGLGVDIPTLQSLVVTLILDGKINAKIDQVKSLLVMGGGSTGEDVPRYQALDGWTRQLARFELPTPTRGQLGLDMPRGRGGMDFMMGY